MYVSLYCISNICFVDEKVPQISDKNLLPVDSKSKDHPQIKKHTIVQMEVLNIYNIKITLNHINIHIQKN